MMRLRRAEAVRYGELQDASLGEFGEGLNLVYGRNEAGKSTFTSLIRQVLYGFPRRAGGERLYLTPSGDNRVGRLEFVDEEKSWIVERTEGPHGGQAVVHGPEGEIPGESFLDRLTRGVSAAVYRTVFGFGLEELSSQGSLEDIQSRLYATTAGLEVNPHDVLDSLRSREEALWSARARTKQIHLLIKELRKKREERRRLEEAAERFREDRERREEVAELLGSAEVAEAEARIGAERLLAVYGEAKRLDSRIREEGKEATAQRRAAETAGREAETIELDEALLENSEAIDRLTSRSEVFISDARLLREEEGRRREINTELKNRLAELGSKWTLDEIADFPLDFDLENRLDEFADQIREARRDRDESARRATEARVKHSAAESVAAELVERLRLEEGEEEEKSEDGPDLTETIGVRLEAVDRLLSLSPAAVPRSASLYPGLAAAGIALVMVVAGIVIDNLPLILAGVLPALLSGVLIIQAMRKGQKGVPPEMETFLEILGLEAHPGGADLIEKKQVLESCAEAKRKEEDLGQDAAAKETVAKESVAALERLWSDWIEWLDDRHLRTNSDQPGSVHQVLRQLRDARAKLDVSRDSDETISRHRAACRRYIGEAEKLGALAVGVEESTEFDEVIPGVRALFHRLEAARGAVEEQGRLEAEKIRAEERVCEAEQRVEEARTDLVKLFSEAYLAEGGGLADLEALVAVARRRADEAAAAHDRLLEERATLDGLLRAGAQEKESAKLRLQESGVIERLQDALDNYAVIKVAVKILEEALGAYERDRQPVVIQRAQEVFSDLTQGRYSRVTTPFGEFSPTVTDKDSVSKTPERLSRATSEQLFLALRLSYVENLADAHRSLPVLMDDVLVNFDEDRRRAAVSVLSKFAASRQVIFFTCHSETFEVFETDAENYTLLELNN